MNRFNPLKINDKWTLKNRVVVPAMASETATIEGEVTQNTLDHYERLTQSGASLIIVEYSYVHLSGKSELNQLGIHSDQLLTGLKKLSHQINSKGVLSGIQLTHACGKTSMEVNSGKIIAPSEVSVPVKDKVMQKPFSMTSSEIEELKLWFFQSAQRASMSGFKLVELHAAHGYGLNQFISPLTNKRVDQYGGELKNRLRIILDIVCKIKKELPDLLVSVRIPGKEGMSGGLTIDDGIEISKLLINAGVDLISVSSGIGGWRRPQNREGEGYLVPEARVIQNSVGNFPIIGVGGIQTAQTIDHFLAEHSFSLAAVGRAILRDPNEWRLKQMKS